MTATTGRTSSATATPASRPCCRSLKSTPNGTLPHGPPSTTITVICFPHHRRDSRAACPRRRHRPVCPRLRSMPSCVNGRREHRSARKRRTTGSWTACGREKLSVDDDSAAVSPTLPIMVSMTRRMDSKTGVAASSHKDEPDTESKAIQTPRRILDAAAYVLSTKGYAGLLPVSVCTVLQALPADTPAIDRLLAAVDAHLRHGLQISDYGGLGAQCRAGTDQDPPASHAGTRTIQ